MPMKRLCELAGVEQPTHRGNGTPVSLPVYSGNMHPNATTETYNYYVKVSHPSNVFINEIFKNIHLYQLGSVVDMDMDDDEVYWLLFKPNHDGKKINEILNNLFGSGIYIEFLEEDEI